MWKMSTEKMFEMLSLRDLHICWKVVVANICVWICFVDTFVSGYNLEVNKASFARGELRSQFGYSLGVIKTPGWTDSPEKAFHGKTLLVGAPDKDLPHFETGDVVKSHGEVRQCRLHKRPRRNVTCSHLQVRDPQNIGKKLTQNYTITYCETQMRLGMTLAVNPKYDDLRESSPKVPLVTVCAPLWKNTYMEKTTFQHEMYGMCLRMKDDLSVQDCIHKRNKYCWPFWPVDSSYRFRDGRPVFPYAEAGMSVTYAENGRSDIIGGPGTRGWNGAVAFPGLSRYYPPVDEHTNIFMSEYKGYAVTSGKFALDNSNAAVGVPNSYRMTGAYKGMVEVLKDAMKTWVISYGKIFPCDEYPTTELPPIQMTQVGTKFGAALASVDVDGDGYDELFVGAPLYSGDRQDEGRVFVYSFTPKSVCGPVGILSGSSRVTSLMDKATGGRFGTTIAPVGDLDKDGFQDVGVGAPYEDDGSGALYIYRGNHGNTAECCLMEDTYSQRIVGKDVDSGLRGFGWSIFGDVDVDANQYPDVAVGAYVSDTAVILRSRPVVGVKATMRVDPDPIPLSAANLSCSVDGFKICTLVHVALFFESQDVKKLTLTLDLEADTVYQQQNEHSRVIFRTLQAAILSENITLHSGQLSAREYILDVELYQGDPTPKDQWTPMRVAGEIHLVESSRERFTKLDPILKTSVEKSFSYNALFDKKCERIELCKSDTVLDVQLVFKRRGLSEKVNNSTILILGNAQELVVTIDIGNKMETSYGLNFTINANVGIKGSVEYVFGGRDDDCTYTGSVNQDTSVFCTGAFRLAKKDKLRAVAYLDVSPDLLAPNRDLNSLQKNLNITVNAVQANIDENPHNNEYNLVIPILMRSDLNVQEDSRTSDHVRYSNNENSELALPVLHRFFITNYGPSYSLDTYIKISIPVSQGPVQIATIKNMTSSCIPFDEYTGEYIDEQVLGFITSNDSDVTENTASSRPRADINCDTYQCEIIACRLRSLEVLEQESVYVELDVYEKELAALESSRSLLFESTAVVMDPSHLYGDKMARWPKPFSASKMTTFRVTSVTQSQDIPLWILLASGGGAILFLLLLILILYKCGFFRRKKHSEVLKLKEKSLYPERSRYTLNSMEPVADDAADTGDQTEDAMLRHKARASIASS